jgi:hypothetical protein
VAEFAATVASLDARYGAGARADAAA